MATAKIRGDGFIIEKEQKELTATEKLAARINILQAEKALLQGENAGLRYRIKQLELQLDAFAEDFAAR